MKQYIEELYNEMQEVMGKPLTLGRVEEVKTYAKTIHALEKLEGREEHEAFDRAAAEKWAKHMENADGTTGAHWTMSQTDAVAESIGLPHDIPRWAWGVAMNMMYSDYYDVAMQFGVNRPDFYAALAKAFLMDKDAPAPVEKLCAYYEHIARKFS